MPMPEAKQGGPTRILASEYCGKIVLRRTAAVLLVLALCLGSLVMVTEPILVICRIRNNSFLFPFRYARDLWHCRFPSSSENAMANEGESGGNGEDTGEEKSNLREGIKEDVIQVGKNAEMVKEETIAITESQSAESSSGGKESGSINTSSIEPVVV
ncbi:MAG: hypothetical protein LBT98_02550, partial [Puniceicoccales bacterium]|nr:hypothetical protein [Puniceicoccales bacterium]